VRSDFRDLCAAAGVDLVFARLPLFLRGLGEVDVVITSDGRSSNAGELTSATISRPAPFYNAGRVTFTRFRPGQLLLATMLANMNTATTGLLDRLSALEDGSEISGSDGFSR